MIQFRLSGKDNSNPNFKIYDFQRASFDELNGSSGTSGKQTGLRNNRPQPGGGCIFCMSLSNLYPEKSRKDSFFDKKKNKKAKKTKLDN